MRTFPIKGGGPGAERGVVRPVWRCPTLVALVLAVSAIWLAAAAPGVAPAAADRGLELVTPPLPGPNINNVTGISADGGRVVFVSLGALPGAEAGDVISYNLAERGAEGWASTPVGPAYEIKKVNLPTRPVAFDDSLRTSLWMSALPLTPDGQKEGAYGFYRRNPDGSLAPLADVGETEPGVIGASADASRLVFATNVHLLPSDAARVSGSGIYELAAGTLRQVDVGDDGQAVSTCGADTSGATSVVNSGGLATAVPESGDRIVFGAQPDCEGVNRIFLRDGTDTVEASASRCTRPDCGPPRSVTFVGATPDGGSVFMVTAEQLVDEDTDEASDLYRFDAAGEALTLLTPAIPGADGQVLPEPVHAGVGGLRVYFYANGRLLPGIGAPGDTNLYLWQGGQLHFVDAQRADQPLQTSPDGRYALLATSLPLSEQETEREMLFSFDGSDSDAGRFEGLKRIGVDEATGSVYVLDVGHDAVSKFTPEGEAAPFAASGSSSLSGAGTPDGFFGLNGEADISVDNSGTASQGRIYVNAEYGPVNAFAPDGSYLWQLSADLFSDDCGTAVDGDGHLWVSDFSDGEALEFAATSGTPEQIGQVKSNLGSPCRLNVDREGNLYLNVWNGRVDKYVGGSFDSTLDPRETQDVAANQSGGEGRVFTVHGDGFDEFTVGEGLRSSSGGGVVKGGVGIAYNPQLDWVYVADAQDQAVKVFGPPVSRPASEAPVEGSDEDGSTDVYRYDAVANRLRLLSVGSIGGSGPQRATFVSPLEENGFLLPFNRFPAMSAGGGRVWFGTAERLLPEDQNDAEDVYEWEAGGLSLVTPGTGSRPAQFAGASADGSTVLFRTTRTLLGVDRDGGDNDIYAARIGGGFPEPQEPGCVEPCERQPSTAAPYEKPPTEAGGERRRGRLRIERLPRGLAAAIVRSGRTTIAVHAPFAGLLSARVWAGKALVARGTAGATRAGRVPVVLAWSEKARAALGAGRILRVRLRVSVGKDAVTRRLTLAGGGGR
jgi:hypothetical protein